MLAKHDENKENMLVKTDFRDNQKMIKRNRCTRTFDQYDIVGQVNRLKKKLYFANIFERKNNKYYTCL